MADEAPGPAHLLAAGQAATSVLEPVAEADWSVPAGELRWSCRRTLDHMADALLHYAAHLARRAARPVPSPRNGDADASLPELIATVTSAAAILASVADAAGPTARAYHPAGMADRSGFCAMGADEIVVHTYDIANGLGVRFDPPTELCAAVVERLFPWASDVADPWAALLWANGRRALPDHERLDADWYWHCAPLREWDGAVARRARPPRWR